MEQATLTEPTLRDVVKARARIEPHIYHPEMRRSDALSRLAGREIWLKPESLQRTGAYKIRGALNRLMTHRAKSGRSVITASSGNHAIGVTIGGHLTGVETTIVVPETLSASKWAKLEALGANLVVDGAGFDETEDRVFERAALEGLDVVTSFDPDVIAGHGTVAMEMFEEVPDLETIIAPVASGGLLAGCAVVRNQVSPGCRVYGVQAANAPAMKASLDAGELIPVEDSPTIADGLAGNALRSVLPFQIIQRSVEDVWLVEEPSIYRAIWHALTTEQLVLEGAGAVTIAAVLEGALPPGDGPVGIVLSGGNLAPEVLTEAVKRAG